MRSGGWFDGPLRGLEGAHSEGARFNPMTAVNGESAAPNFPESYLECEGLRSSPDPGAFVSGC